MLEERQSEVERLQQELLVVPVQLQADFDNSIRSLQSKCEVVEERDEDLYVLNEEKVSADALSNCALIAAIINSLFPLCFTLLWERRVVRPSKVTFFVFLRYSLQEALASRVKELETELAVLRRTSTSAFVDVSEAASQTDPLISTAESGIQVDIDQRPSPSPAPLSPGDTDCASEDDLPYDGDFITANQTEEVQLAAPPQLASQPKTVEEVKAVVDHLQHESCRLLSLSLAAADHDAENAGGNEIEPTDYKSQALSRLIEANRMLKNALEEINKKVRDQLISYRAQVLKSADFEVREQKYRF